MSSNKFYKRKPTIAYTASPMIALSTAPIAASTPAASSTVSGSRLNNSMFPEQNRQQGNTDQKLDFAYNDYLQSMMKKYIVESAIRNFESLLKEQIEYQQERIERMREICGKRKMSMNDMIQQNELIRVLQDVEEKFEKFEKLTAKSQDMERFVNFSNILTVATKDLKLVGVHKLVNVEEWLSFVTIMNRCCNFLRSVFNSHKDMKEFKLIDDVSARVQCILDLQMKIQKEIVKMSSVKKELCLQYLKEVQEIVPVVNLMVLG